MDDNSARIFWSILGGCFLFAIISTGLIYDWPAAFMTGLGVGVVLGSGLAIVSRSRWFSRPSSHHQRSIVLIAPISGMLIVGLLRLIGWSDLMFFVGGSAYMMMLIEATRLVLFGEYQPPPTADRRSPSTQTGHERLRREEEQWREEQRRKREQGR